jgi:hypothetical protein
MAYQWNKNGLPVSGATSQTLVLTNLQTSDAALYSVVITNSSGSVTSAPANLSVSVSGVTIALYPGITIDGVVGYTYGIQSTTDLSTTNGWIGRTNITLTAPTQLWYDSLPALQPQHYYRVVPGPIPIP